MIPHSSAVRLVDLQDRNSMKNRRYSESSDVKFNSRSLDMRRQEHKYERNSVALNKKLKSSKVITQK